MIQNLWWAFAYNIVAIPAAAGTFAAWGFFLRPEIGALLMAGSRRDQCDQLARSQARPGSHINFAKVKRPGHKGSSNGAPFIKHKTAPIWAIGRPPVPLHVCLILESYVRSQILDYRSHSPSATCIRA